MSHVRSFWNNLREVGFWNAVARTSLCWLSSALLWWGSVYVWTGITAVYFGLVGLFLFVATLRFWLMDRKLRAMLKHLEKLRSEK